MRRTPHATGPAPGAAGRGSLGGLRSSSAPAAGGQTVVAAPPGRRRPAGAGSAPGDGHDGRRTSGAVGQERAARCNLKGVSTVAQHREPVRQHHAALHQRQWSSPTATPPSSTSTRRSSVPGRPSLFDQTCSSCHGTEANGVPRGQATIGPNLLGVGPATVDFWVTTGRMPAADTNAVQAERKPPRLTDQQALEVAAYVNSLDPAVPAVPTPNLKGANLADGGQPVLAELRRLPHHHRRGRRPGLRHLRPVAAATSRSPRSRSPRPSAPARPTCPASPATSPTPRCATSWPT